MSSQQKKSFRLVGPSQCYIPTITVRVILTMLPGQSVLYHFCKKTRNLVLMKGVKSPSLHPILYSTHNSIPKSYLFTKYFDICLLLPSFLSVQKLLGVLQPCVPPIRILAGLGKESPCLALVWDIGVSVALLCAHMRRHVIIRENCSFRFCRWRCCH